MVASSDDVVAGCASEGLYGSYRDEASCPMIENSGLSTHEMVVVAPFWVPGSPRLASVCVLLSPALGAVLTAGSDECWARISPADCWLWIWLVGS